MIGDMEKTWDELKKRIVFKIDELNFSWQSRNLAE